MKKKTLCLLATCFAVFFAMEHPARASSNYEASSEQTLNTAISAPFAQDPDNPSYYQDKMINFTSDISLTQQLSDVSSPPMTAITTFTGDNRTLDGKNQTGFINNGYLIINHLNLTNFKSSIVNNNYFAINNNGSNYSTITNNVGENGGFVYCNNNSQSNLLLGYYSNNTAKLGGVIYGNTAQEGFHHDVFENNSAIATGADDALGGVMYLYNSTSGNNYDLVFSGNYAKTINGNAKGGAIYNDGTNLETENTYFKSNYVQSTAGSAQGGAIYNNNIVTLLSPNFNGNYAQTSSGLAQGGAIYNDGSSSKITITGDTGDIVFSDNYTSNDGGITKISNAIHNNGGTINLNGSARFIFNDKITGENGGTLNINSNNETLFNETVTGNLINLNSGMLKLGEYKNSRTTTYFDNTTDLNLVAGTLNTANGDIDNIEVNNLSLNNTYQILDWGDNFKFQNLNTYQIQISGINIVSESTPISGYNLFTGPQADIINLGDCCEAYTNNNKYTFTIDTSEAGFLKIEPLVTPLTPNSGLNQAISSSGYSPRSFSAVSDLTLNSNLGELYPDTSSLTIFGNQYNINGNGKSGLILNNGNQTVSIFDVNSFSGFKTSDLGGVIEDTTTSPSNTISIYNSNFSSNSSETNNTKAGGGAILANSSTFSIYDSNFTNNYAKSLNNDSIGGAIYNLDSSSTTITNSTFDGNYAEAKNNAQGGAAAFQSCTYINNSNFKNNNAIATDGNALGGAVYNDSGASYFLDTNFTNNHATSTNGSGYGGAIYNSAGNIYIIATNKDVTFSGNTASTEGNDIYITNSGTLNLNARYGHKITFNGGIASTNEIIQINEDGMSSGGEIVLNAPITTSKIDLNEGTISLGNDTYLNGNDLTLNGGTLNLQNNNAGNMLLSNLTLQSIANLKIDVDLANSKADTINSTSTATISDPASHINITSINLLSDAKSTAVGSKTTTSITDDTNLKSAINLIVNKACTPIYQYGVAYDGNGNLVFTGLGGGNPWNNNYQNFNPAILNSPVSANAGAYMSQIGIYNEAMNRSDLFMSLPQNERLLMKYSNKYADNGTIDVAGQVFSPTFLPNKKAGVWFKQYSSFENIPLNNGPNVSNVGYGAMVGADTALVSLGHGTEGYITAYAAYNGSHQNYESVGVNQNGGALGITGTLYKGNLFTAITASIGDSYGQAKTIYGTDNFNTLLAGLAWKTGYNFEILKGKIILQPSIFASYTFAKTFDYMTASGVNITSDPLNAIQISPGAKFIYNAKNGWQPYLAMNMVWNIMDSQKFYANDAQLPQMSIAPYFEYGLGIQRRWSERFTGFAQTMLRGGGRNGIALQFGFRMAIGK